MTQIAIIGAGIGGLTLYHALRQCGIAATLYERAPVLKEVGTGLLVPSNGMQVLARLGLADDVLRHGWVLERAEIRDTAAGVLRTLELAPYARQFGYGIVGIHRAALHDLMTAGVAPADLHLGKACVRVRAASENGADAEVSFADGSAVRASVVVGADGVRSAVRQSIFPSSRLRTWRHTGYRAVVSFDLPPHLSRLGHQVWSDGYEFGFAGIGGGRVYWYASVPSAMAERVEAERVMEDLKRRAAALPEPLRNLVAAISEDALVKTDLYDLASLKEWHHGNVVLMGDAAHASLPYLGQGGAQAMEDAYALAAALARTATPASAFAAYQRARRTKANMVVRLSRILGHFAGVRSPVLRVARNLAYHTTPDFVARRQMNQLFRVDF